MTASLSIANIEAAAVRIKPFTHVTPVFTAQSINSISGAEVFFKAENLQKTGSFKARGAVNALFSIDDKCIEKGVITHSSGNHGAALAYSAKCRGTNAFVVMPQNAACVKIAAVEGYGGNITFCKPTQQDRENAVDELTKETGASFIHPYNNYRVIVGQATAAFELLKQVEGLEVIIAPVGGGGLLSGTALAASALKPEVKIFGAEPAGADDAFRSLQAGVIMPLHNPVTIADGLRTSLGSLTFPLIKDHVEGIITVSEKAIAEAMRFSWERLKMVVEPSAAVPLAALLKESEKFRGLKVALIVSGGNVDLDDLPRLLKVGSSSG